MTEPRPDTRDKSAVLGADSAPPADRRPTAMEVGAPVRLTPMGASYAPAWEKVTSVSVIAFTAEGTMVVADLERGLDLPGGHTQENERCGEETARREAWEETRVLVDDLVPIEVIESDYFGADDLTYMIIYSGLCRHLAPWTPGDDESRGRLLMAPEAFLSRYTTGDLDLMTHLVTTAKARIAPCTS